MELNAKALGSIFSSTKEEKKGEGGRKGRKNGGKEGKKDASEEVPVLFSFMTFEKSFHFLESVKKVFNQISPFNPLIHYFIYTVNYKHKPVCNE